MQPLKSLVTPLEYRLFERYNLHPPHKVSMTWVRKKRIELLSYNPPRKSLDFEELADYPYDQASGVQFRKEILIPLLEEHFFIEIDFGDNAWWIGPAWFRHAFKNLPLTPKEARYRITLKNVPEFYQSVAYKASGG